jgi:hypothetical protein
MIIPIYLSSILHPTIYYFLASLSFIHLCHSTVIVPKMLVNFMTVYSALLFPHFYCLRLLHVGCNGLWLLCTIYVALLHHHI